MVTEEGYQLVIVVSFFTMMLMLVFMLMPRLFKAKINPFCIIWIGFSVYAMSSNYITIVPYLVPEYSSKFTPLVEGDPINIIKGAIQAAAFNALPSLIFWHGGTPYRELPEEIAKALPARYISQEEIAVKRAAWQKTCYLCVLVDLTICLLGFIAIKMM